MAAEDIFAAIEVEAAKPLTAQNDTLAKKEQEALENGRTQVQTELHKLVRYSLRFGAVLIGALICVRFWHLGSPEAWRWLSDEDVQGIDKMLFSSAFGGVVITYLKDVLSPQQQKS
ncbi:hypothetical protein [Oceanimonas doudoroffii]|uniref:Holin of 3TMs, for gene-transfer release n=1 Tax=Oceanimonas doudoroffii TaxID=84158 RepID=A0A233RJC7_9GAMM|nr:hypothetical protein [Oceanimonas doudoroffii]OXY83498.1 hypothetical protein B6S08_08445 [Oceanimonas doudoroffii]